MTKESDILYQSGSYWVLRTNSAYHVMKDSVTHAVSDSSYSKDANGLSLAIARCKYLANR